MKLSEFYKKRRPEYFSDSEITNQITLPRQVLAYELSTISTNQKQDQFETLCRKLSERFIVPNLIPQVGPTGGGDGKTDFETYPASVSISDRWFVPENGWEKDEKWAFAISAKKQWKGKLKSDITKIVGTNREYTRVYFLTNQLVSSRKKKEAQDEFIKEFKIDVVILDGEWILEKIYSNDLIALVVDCLNLSDVYKNEEVRLGKNDAERLKQLEDIENNINNHNRYFEYDYQLVEDALESAILSRMLEKPRDEVEGKFYRVFRFCKKTNNLKQWIRFYYQRAWTYVNYYDDYQLFLENYKKFKEYISDKSNMCEIELYYNLFNLLNTLDFSGNCNLIDYQIDINQERNDIKNILVIIENNLEKPSSALRAKTYRIIYETLDSIRENKNPNQYLKELANIVLESRQFWDYPFESTKQIIEEIGSTFANNSEYDNLIDNVAEVSEKRNSELSSGETFLKRGIQKVEASYYQESLIYFGKAIVKLAKEETQKLMYLTLVGLGFAYSKLGLIWASNNCYVYACCLSFKMLDEQSSSKENIYDSLKQIIENELLIGRIPSFLTWYEMFSILSKQFDLYEPNDDDISFSTLINGCFSVRLLHTDSTNEKLLQYLPDILEKQELWLAQNTTLYKQGYIDLIIGDYQDSSINNEQELDNHFTEISQQPFVEQMLYETNFMSDNILKLQTNILGCKFMVTFSQDLEMLLVAETILAFLEGFFATSLKDAISLTEKITINIKNNQKNNKINFDYNELKSEYNFYLQSFNNSENNSNLTWLSLIEFVADIFVKNFMTKNPQEYITKLFKKEEIHERLSSILSHRDLILNLLGNKPKLFFDNWINYVKPQQYPIKRQKPIIYDYQDSNNQKKYITKENLDEIGHNKRTVHSIINVSLWDQAKWISFGIFSHPQHGLCILLLYENIDIGKKIFTQWINKFGYEDEEEYIKITIIRGINKEYPYQYRVHISSNIESKNFASANRNELFTIASRVNTMSPNSPETLDNLMNMFNQLKQYKICPAKIIDDGKDIEPYFDQGILKKSLTIKEAWQIGENDLDRVAIREDDCPIIPKEHSKDAPVLDILKHLEKNN